MPCPPPLTAALRSGAGRVPFPDTRAGDGAGTREVAMRRMLLLLVLVGLAGLVAYLGWRPLQRQVRMWRMERNPSSFVVE